MTDEADATTPAAAAPPEPTGIAALDAAVDQVAALEDRPLADHVAAFENAHAELRRPLDDPPAELDAPQHHP